MYVCVCVCVLTWCVVLSIALTLTSVCAGIRIGSPALTTRGFVEKDMESVAEFIVRGVDIAINLKKQAAADDIKKIKVSLNCPLLCSFSVVNMCMLGLP